MNKIYVNADTSPQLRFTIIKNNAVVNLTGATASVKVKLGDGTTFTKAMTLVDAVNGILGVTFTATELDVQGRATLEIVITFSGGAIQHARRPYVIYVRNEHEDPVL